MLPLMPFVFMPDEARYVIFEASDKNYVMTIKGKIDNQKGESIEANQIDRVARGCFLRDVSFGFYTYDGFVVWYEVETNSWGFTSMTLGPREVNLDERSLDLTQTPDEGVWDCEVTQDPSPTPLWDELVCSRLIPEQASYENQEIRYAPKVVVDVYGYRFDGIDSSRWEPAGQITLALADQMKLGLVALASLYLAF